MDYNWHDFIGNIGVAVIILSYLALQLERIDSRSYLFCTLNGAGAAMIILSLMFEFNLSAFIVEAFWFLISLLGIIRRLNANKTRTSGIAEL